MCIILWTLFFSDVTLLFSEVDFSNTEARNVIEVRLELSTTIAVDLVVDLIPLNLTFARASGQLPSSLDPELTDPNFDPDTQTATSKLRCRLLSTAESLLSLTLFLQVLMIFLPCVCESPLLVGVAQSL